MSDQWLPLLLLLLSLLSAFTAPSTAGDSITAPETLSDGGGTLVSLNELYELGFFNPNNSNNNNRYLGIWYHKIPVQTVVWVANRAHPILDRTGVLNFTENGTLVLLNQTGTIFWSSSSATNTSTPVARLLDSGNLVLMDGAGDANVFAWQSFDHPTDTHMPGMKFGWDFRTGLNRYLTSWKSASDPSPGDYTIMFDLRGVPQVLTRDISVVTYRSGPWNGIRWNGVPAQTSNNSIYNYTYVSNNNEIYYMYLLSSDAEVTRLFLDPSGVLDRPVWVESAQSWTSFLSGPSDKCDPYSLCGPYGICDMDTIPICNCLKGFSPKSPRDWYLREAKGGCVRNTKLGCEEGGDGFMKLSDVKVPESSNATVDATMGLDECAKKCLMNCSCTAYATSNISSGIGCLNWFGELIDSRTYPNGGQDLYVRLAASDLDKGGHTKKKTSVGVIVVATVVPGILLLSVVGYCLKRRRWWARKLVRRGGTIEYFREIRSATETELPLFDLETVRNATNNFSTSNVLGEGGYGPVYWGKLEEGQDVAVKRLAKTSIQGAEEFKNEIMLIAKVQHRNLVRLLGCCIEGDERMLIYEYMPNKSLDTFIFDFTKSASMDWQKRNDIIMGIARGLLYLHQDSRLRIIHRDLKASNILLDKELKPKISDFGLARIFGGDQDEAKTKRVVGTYGYMSPEYAMDGVFSVKSDVFSFGVLVLEILSGRRNRGFYQSEPDSNLLRNAWRLWKEGRGLELLDTSIGHVYPVIEVMRCLQVGLLCVQEQAEDRPTMSWVVMMLGSEAVTLPQPKQPAFSTGKGVPEADQSSGLHEESRSVNEVTMTILQNPELTSHRLRGFSAY
ncbi:Receptor-like serine/threonine-protein kinase SD1-8 [Acorus gramineus]|uniref:Receptor-like serine/threonine-protein kinase n=1 Tax=Acorus gramineus TaxID=55184 RepID=A0AAV9AA22_ACOGR|nr:Receptor-like serine/threonine-protein kinase SD1-8 [Acorus gramineus]